MPSTRHAKRRILIVDDDPTFALLATETLEQVAFSVRVAATGPEAIAAFAAFTPDLVLLDVNIPGGNGFDLCRSFRAAPSNADVPVVMVTGLEDTESIARAYEAGATDFLHKPVLCCRTLWISCSAHWTTAGRWFTANARPERSCKRCPMRSQRSTLEAS